MPSPARPRSSLLSNKKKNSDPAPLPCPALVLSRPKDKPLPPHPHAALPSPGAVPPVWWRSPRRFGSGGLGSTWRGSRRNGRWRTTPRRWIGRRRSGSTARRMSEGLRCTSQWNR